MKIEKLPAVLVFPDGDDANQAVLRIGAEDGYAVYSFTVMVPLLVRMGGEKDSSVSLCIDDVWYVFTPAGRSDIDDAVMECRILENSSKRSRFRLTVRIRGDVPAEIRAKAGNLFID